MMIMNLAYWTEPCGVRRVIDHIMYWETQVHSLQQGSELMAYMQCPHLSEHLEFGMGRREEDFIHKQEQMGLCKELWVWQTHTLFWQIQGLCSLATSRGLYAKGCRINFLREREKNNMGIHSVTIMDFFFAIPSSNNFLKIK